MAWSDAGERLETLPTAGTGSNFVVSNRPAVSAPATAACRCRSQSLTASGMIYDHVSFKLRAPEPNAKRGGVLRFGVLSAPAHFDVHQSGTVSNIGTQGCMYDILIRRDP